ncbi:MAG: ribonuclease III [Pseudanabaenales cyanobacterium]|nr:ribonuclease III [Pseudanabaenales cyanobacterium]
MPVSLDPRRQKELQRLALKLGLCDSAPVDWEKLDLALTHISISAAENYEQLEFLGDAALRLAAAEFLLEAYPNLKVGEMAAIRSHLVSDRTLAELADCYGLERYLLISASAAGDKAGRQSRLADAFEAILGALYLSTQSLDLIRPWLDSHLKRLAAEVRTDPARQNYKAALQELTQAYNRTLPEYRVQEIKQSHGDPERFSAEAWFQGRRWGCGKGASIKLAEQAAAEEAFWALKKGLGNRG